MTYEYNTRGTCSTKISFELEGNIIKNVIFTGGCSGNLLAVSALIDGMTVDEIEEKLGGLKCGFRNTSCADQLTKAVREAYDRGSAEKRNENE